MIKYLVIYWKSLSNAIESIFIIKILPKMHKHSLGFGQLKTELLGFQFFYLFITSCGFHKHEFDL